MSITNQRTKEMAAGSCPVCGGPLPPQVPPSRCPHCLLRQGLPTREVGSPGETLVVTDATPARALPEPGATFGHYRIGRLLGQGGMGAVFEAEDLESGRRVALKVLGHRIDSPEARSRFFREGRLAASVNHPNSVYVFGTEEIAGIPVIAMELMAGGTLQDRVSRQGPLPVAEVADSVLQIIAGLESAQRAGILHRDIKPSNCFVEADGTVKIGDFGLSISTLVRTEPAITATGAFLGTPAFSSPEQLRGDELTVRSDIYSVGVTLYYLLTGHHPFEAPDMVRLLATVLERPAESPAKQRPGLPSGLCRAVLRCLQKDPDKRFRNYDELRNALLPYASAVPTPATVGLRLVAYGLDMLLLALANTLIISGVRAAANHLTLSQFLLVNLLDTALLALLYYGLLEGLWGASVGKAICRLQVARLDRTLPGVPRALLRAFVLAAPPHAVWLLGWGAAHAWASGGSLSGWMTVVGLLGLEARVLPFTTARRRNGFAGWHDLASSTRVIAKPAYEPRPALPRVKEALPKMQTLPQIGPYHVLNRIGGEDGTELMLGFDARLLRHVWIRRLSPGAPPLPANLRHLSRPGRLRWLSAKRAEAEAWDAYEAPPGQPLLALLREPQEWSRARYWLLDLAEELRAATQDRSLPSTLSLDRVWITADGRAKLLDFPAPGTAGLQPDRPAEVESVAPSRFAFLRHVAISAVEGRPANSGGAGPGTPKVPLALHARRFLETLKPGASLEECITHLRSLLSAPAQVSRARRLVLLAGVLALPVLTVAVAGFALARTAAFFHAAPELATLRECLAHHQELQDQAKPGKLDQAADREALEIYIAGRFAPVITNAVLWNEFNTRVAITDSLRDEAERILTRRPPPSPGQFAEASATVERFFKKSPDLAAQEAIKQVKLPLAVLLVGYGSAVMLVVLPCLIASLLFRGGAIVKLLGIVFVNRTGALSSRLRVAWRNLLAWLPFLVLPAGVKLLAPVLGMNGSTVAVIGLSAGLALASALLPKRGLADRLAGTWLVPR